MAPISVTLYPRCSRNGRQLNVSPLGVLKGKTDQRERTTGLQ